MRSASSAENLRKSAKRSLSLRRKVYGNFRPYGNGSCLEAACGAETDKVRQRPTCLRPSTSRLPTCLLSIPGCPRRPYPTGDGAAFGVGNDTNPVRVGWPQPTTRSQQKNSGPLSQRALPRPTALKRRVNSLQATAQTADIPHWHNLDAVTERKHLRFFAGTQPHGLANFPRSDDLEFGRNGHGLHLVKS